jgi:predicted transcriptional regulator
MNSSDNMRLSRRQKEIMDILFQRGQASVAEIMAGLPSSPTSGAVRRMLNILYEKGLVEYTQDGPRKLYRPAVDRRQASRQALSHVVDTFFEGSAARTMAALFQATDLSLDDEEKQLLSELIEKARRDGR